MCRLQTTLEIGECLYERSRALARRDIDFVPGTQMPDKACEKTLGGAYRLKRKVRDIVARAREETAHFFPEERAEVDVLQDEFDALDIPIETGAAFRKYARAATRFILGEREESAEKTYRDKDEDKIRHG